MKKKRGNDKNLQDRFLAVLYGSFAGRALLKIMISPGFSRLGGRLLETRISALAAGPFAGKNGIDLSECRKKKFCSFNDFFQRELIPGARPLDSEKDSFISPCDARLSVYRITEEQRFTVKNTAYTLAELLKDETLARRYQGGTLWLLRLCVDDYHRYIYPLTGQKSANKTIPGVFHTVNPVANDRYPIYKENTREYCLLKTKDCGTVLMMEVGAMLVGKIENRQRGRAEVTRGQEKGAFAFGGSTIILLTRKGRVRPGDIYITNTAQGLETRVRLGEKIGTVTTD